MEVPELEPSKIVVTVLLLWVLSLVVRVCNALFVKPRRLREIMKKQGIKGPPTTFLLGNLGDMNKAQAKLQKPPPGEKGIVHNVPAIVFPTFPPWTKQYGNSAGCPTFMFSIGNMEFVHINDPEIVKEITLCTSLGFGKPSFPQKLFDPLLGRGVVNANGSEWSQQRKILAPEFFNEKVKGMTKLMVESASIVVNLLAAEIEKNGGVADINVEHHTTKFARDVISRLCFGSNYSAGEEIFSKLKVLGDITSKIGTINALFPIMKYVPTKDNRESTRLEKEIRALVLKVVKEKKQVGNQKDILQLISEGAKNIGLDQAAADRYIVDNCRNIYVAGYETTAASAMWTLMLLAINPEWQSRVREEVQEICQGQMPDADMIRKMKVLTMVIYESLRLYPPGPLLSREALEDLKFGNIKIPKGLNVWTLFLTLHYDQEIWGPDAHVFKPERFANGISGSCKHPHVYMPFGAGARICLGQHFAMAELRILLSLILSNFSFSLSPKYRHSPILKVIIEPEHGVDLIMRKL
ncbi:hypothetical protein FEM48_Zijuj03G0045800 [Ziziphus jujuba var. spinosa]|uniref:Cytochrome P450 714C2-like n=1 Tax=Ziziphus jujuba var. spinosa TaxID=714518 RepID=A0A978VN78_ZIZJJ|nr:hypothetical protein FEM48_Zijuj03G0045800 [Ziziphus jujuba var. spinosa]